MNYSIFETPLGWMGAVASSAGLIRTTLPQNSREVCELHLRPEEYGASTNSDLFAGLEKKLCMYFDGYQVLLDEEPIDIDHASEFTKSALLKCRTVPIGQTRTYKWLANQIDKPSAWRAVGQCMAKNRIPIIIPCHRIVGSGQYFGGFGAALARTNLKRRLLSLEIDIAKNKALASESNPKF